MIEEEREFTAKRQSDAFAQLKLGSVRCYPINKESKNPVYWFFAKQISPTELEAWRYMPNIDGTGCQHFMVDRFKKWGIYDSRPATEEERAIAMSALLAQAKAEVAEAQEVLREKMEKLQILEESSKPPHSH